MDCPELLELINFHVPARPLRMVNTFSIDYHRTLYGKYSAMNRMLILANGVTEDVFASLNLMKITF